MFRPLFLVTAIVLTLLLITIPGPSVAQHLHHICEALSFSSPDLFPSPDPLTKYQTPVPRSRTANHPSHSQVEKHNQFEAHAYDHTF